MAEEEYLEPGKYLVEAKLRGHITVEVGDKKTEVQIVDELLNDAGAELVDWDVC